MTTRQWILLLICGCMIAALGGCGGGSSSTPPPPTISVSFSTAPPSSLQVSKTAPVAATVTGDSSNAGVDWSCTPASACGSFNPTHTASGSATTYTAPAAVPSGNTVTITAKSTADGTKSVAGNVSITGPISIVFSQAPPSSLQINATAQVGAKVTGDTANKGVDWTCAPAGSCGSFNPAHTASSALTTYTAPSSIPVNRKVAVTATSTADNTKFISNNVTITGNSPIVVVFDPQPTPFMIVSNNSSMTALVANDQGNAGVDWSCVPAPPSCGTFSPTHTASGQPTTYTAPGSPVSATVTAASTTNNSKFAQATVTVATSFGNAALSGSYVFAASGRDSFAYPKGVPPGAYQVTGVFTADGNGNITGGEQIYSDQPLVATDPISASGSSYSIGADGRGTITLNTGDKSIGVGGVEKFSVVLLNGTQGLVTQFDASASSSGTLDLQTVFSKNNVLSGGYAFVTSGVEFAYTKAPLGIGGVFNVDGANTISGAGSVVDINDAGTVTTGIGLASKQSTVAPPDSFGKLVVNLSLNTGAFLTYVGFIVDDTHVKLVEKDRELNAIYGTTGGVAYAQGSSTGTFTNASFNSTVVYSTEGYSTVGTSTLQPTVYAGLFTADGAGNITNGYTDLNQFGTLISDTLTGSYAADSTKTGRVTTSGMFYGNAGAGPSWIFYLTGASDAPALILQLDSKPFIETIGTTYTQAAGPPGVSAFIGPYGMGFTFFPGTGGEDDGTGQATADGVSSLSSGHEDANVCTFDATTKLCKSFTQDPGLTLSGTFGVSGVPGRFTGTLTDNSGTIFNTDPIAFYIADGTRILFIDIGAQPAVGVFRQQQ